MNETTKHLACGGIAGLISDGVVHPIDTVRARMMVTSAASSGTSSATQTFMNILKQEGVPALYRGFSAVAVGVRCRGLFLFQVFN